MGRTTITINVTTKASIEQLKKNSGYKNYDDLLNDMQNFYHRNGLNPRNYHSDMLVSVNDTIKKSLKETDKKLRGYIGFESKAIKQLLGMDVGEHSLKNINDNLVSLANWLIEKLDSSDGKTVQVPAPKIESSPEPAQETPDPDLKVKLHKIESSLKYLIDDLKQNTTTKNGMVLIDESIFIEFELSIRNLIKT